MNFNLIFLICTYILFLFINLRPRFLSCTRMPPFNIHEFQAPDFQPIQEYYYLIFINFNFIFSICECTCECTSLFNFHEFQVPVFSHCDLHFLLFLNTQDFISFHRFIYQNSSPSYTGHFHKSILNPFPKTPQDLKPPDFISHIPIFNCAHFPKSVLNQCPKKNITKPQILQFHLVHPCFELCRNSSPNYSTHCRKFVLNQCPEKKSQNLRPQDFISHIPVLNSSGTIFQITAYISANLPWTNVPRKKIQNLRAQNFISYIPIQNSARTIL